MSRVSFDTNILIYSIDASNAAKQDIARRLVTHCEYAGGVISAQCLAEFYRATTRKRLLTPQDALTIVQRSKVALDVVPYTSAELLSAINSHRIHNLQFFDELLRTSIQRAGATVLFSEDFSHGTTYDRVKVLNPFVMTQTEIDAAFQ